MLSRKQFDDALTKSRANPRIDQVQTSLGPVGVRALAWDDVNEIQQKKVKQGKAFDDVTMIACRVMVDKNGNRLFDDGDAKKLGAMDAGDISAVVVKAKSMVSEAEDLVGDEVEDAGKP